MTDPAQEAASETPDQPEMHPTGAPPVGASLGSTPPTPEENIGADDSTVGTGTSIALGCVVGTIVLIVFGLIFLGIITLLS